MDITDERADCSLYLPMDELDQLLREAPCPVLVITRA